MHERWQRLGRTLAVAALLWAGTTGRAESGETPAPLPDGALRWLGGTALKQQSPLQVATLTPDGERLITNERLSYDTRLHVWEAQGGRWIRSLSGATYVAITISPDGQWIAGAIYQRGGGGVLELRRLGDPQPHSRFRVEAPPNRNHLRRYVIEGENEAYRAAVAADWFHRPSIAFSPEGDRIVLGNGTQVRLWEAGTGRTVASLDHPEGALIVGLAYRGDENIVTATVEGEVRIWDTATERVVRQFDARDDLEAMGVPAGEEQEPSVLAMVSGDGARDESITLADTLVRSNFVMASMAVSPDGKTVALGGSGGYLTLYDLETGELVRRLEGHASAVTFLHFLDDERLLARDVGHGARVWDLATGESVFELATGPGGDAATARGTSVSADGSILWLGAASMDTVAGVWSFSQQRWLARPADHTGRGQRVGWTADGDHLFTQGEARGIVWEATTGKAVGTLELGDDQIDGMWAILPGAAEVVICRTGQRRSVVSVDLSTGKDVHELLSEQRELVGVFPEPDGSRVAVALDPFLFRNDERPGVRLIDAATGEALWTYRVSEAVDEVSAVAWTPDGARLALVVRLDGAGSRDAYQIHLLNADTAVQQVQIDLPEDQGVLTQRAWFGPEGNNLWLHTREGMVRFNARTGAREQTVPLTGPYPVRVQDVSPDGEVAVIQKRFNHAGLVELENGQTLHVFDSHLGLVSAAGFSPDGKQLATFAADGTLLLWDVAALRSRENGEDGG